MSGATPPCLPHIAQATLTSATPVRWLHLTNRDDLPRPSSEPTIVTRLRDGRRVREPKYQPAETPVLDLLEKTTKDSIEASGLDEQTLMMVRIAALVAVDAPPASYLLNVGVASELGLDEQRVRDVLIAVAPIIGTARIASALGNIVRALGLALELVEPELDDSQSCPPALVCATSRVAAGRMQIRGAWRRRQCSCEGILTRRAVTPPRPPRHLHRLREGDR